MLLLETLFRFLPGALAVVGLLVFIFGGSPATSERDPEVPPAASGNGLAGWWEWAESWRDGEVVRPVSAADSLVVVIGAHGAYRERAAGSVLRSGYGFARGTLGQLQDSVFMVLVLDSSNFFPRTNGLHAVAIRDMTPDSLVLSGTGDNATLYTFLRARQ